MPQPEVIMSVPGPDGRKIQVAVNPRNMTVRVEGAHEVTTIFPFYAADEFWFTTREIDAGAEVQLGRRGEPWWPVMGQPVLRVDVEKRLHSMICVSAGQPTSMHTKHTMRLIASAPLRGASKDLLQIS